MRMLEWAINFAKVVGAAALLVVGYGVLGLFGAVVPIREEEGMLPRGQVARMWEWLVTLVKVMGAAMFLVVGYGVLGLYAASIPIPKERQ